MTKKVKMVCFDMDGTIADLYNVDNWLTMLRAEDPTPYRVASPMWNMIELIEVCERLKESGIEVRVITWLSKDSSEDYKRATRKAKAEWLDTVGLTVDHFHAVRYGATKADSIRRYLGEDETAILIDDNEKVRKGWNVGETIDPTTTDIIKALRNLL
jgi:hypothetical protein